MRPCFILLLVGLAAAPALAQAERYELGRRVQQFEAAWEKQPDAGARTRALKALEPAARQFLTLRPTAAAKTLDEARFALRAKPPTDAVRWLTALEVVPAKRLIDADAEQTAVEVRQLYDAPGGPPMGVRAVLTAGVGGGVEVPLDKLPAKVTVPLAPGKVTEYRLTLLASVPGDDTVEHAVTVSALPKLDKLIGLWKASPALDTTTFEAATRDGLAKRLIALANGEVPETEPGAVGLFARVALLDAQVVADKQAFTPATPGDQWVVVPLGRNRDTPCRLFVPKGLDPAKPVPLVVALHGAGGSENLFFDGYGAGRVVKECETRGWLLVAPRCPLALFGGSPPVPDLVEKLAERYPIDRRRVFLVGHSMGAGTAVELAQQKPGAYAGLAVLGGAGRVRKPEPFARLPVFIGVGSADFALAGSRSLSKALADAGAKQVTYREYPDVEHLTVVRQALPDAFAVFDAAAKR